MIPRVFTVSRRRPATRRPFAPTDRGHRVRALARALAVALAVALAILLAPIAERAAADDGKEALDVVFVLDNSGSMKQNDPAFLTRRAVSDFTEAVAADAALDGRIGLVLFDGRARLVQRLTPAGDLASTRRLSDALARLDFSGQRTDSPAAIERALYELRDNGRAEARRAIVFLSDGVIDTGDARRDAEVARWLREDLASEAADQDVRIFGIAFTEDADYRLMQALARSTRARYYRTLAAGDLPGVVVDVLERVSEPPTYELAFVEESSPPPVAAAPLAIDAGRGDRTDAGGGLADVLLGWLPLALLLVGAGLIVRLRGGHLSRWIGASSATRVPPAQLFDPGGQVGDAGRALPLRRDRTTIGRDPHNDIVLEDDTISSEHAVIEVHDGRYWIQDLRSTNGTRLADQRLAADERRPLKGGDHIRFADVDLMFVMEGYVPGGATAYLSSSTNPPADWSRFESPEPSLPPAADAAPEPEPAAATPAAADPERAAGAPAEEVRRAGAADPHVAFAEARERLDPASILDLDEALAPADEETPRREAVPEPPSATDKEAIARADAALAAIEAEEADAAATPDDPEPAAEPKPVSALADAASEPVVAASEPVAAAGEPVAAVDLNATTEIPLGRRDATTPPVDVLRRCLDYHLARVGELAPPFDAFVDRAFGEDLREALAVAARELLEAAAEQGRSVTREYTHDRVRFVVCGVSGPMERARDRFLADHGGFTRLIMEQLQAESFRGERCEILAILTFGDAPQPWVSLSIVPDEGQDPRIDLLSYEFLTEEERREIEPRVDPEISQSGLG